MGKKKGIDITGAIGAFDDEYVTVPKGELGIKKKDKSLTLSLEKPFSKKSKQNINSTIGASFTKEGKDSSLSLTGSKTGKSKAGIITLPLRSFTNFTSFVICSRSSSDCE